MNKIQFLLLFITFIPFFTSIIVLLIRKNGDLLCNISSLLSFIMMFNIINLISNYNGDLNAISIITINNNLDIGFSITGISLIISLITTFIWLVINIYSNKYFSLIADERFFTFKFFSILIFGFITLIIFSKNLVSLFLFYQCLIFCVYFLSGYFLYHKDSKASHNFVFFLLVSSLFMLLATILTYKTTGTTEFQNNGIINGNVSNKEYFLLLIFFIMSFACIALFPIHIFFKKLYPLSSPIIITIFIISYGLTSLLITVKIILNIFGFEFFIQNTNNFNFSYILNFIIAINLIASGILTIIQNNLKKILIFLFFNQLIFAFFLFLILNQSIYQFIITIISFILSQSLIFLSFGNINIYLLKSNAKILPGAFYKLKRTSLFLLFALFSLIGIVPSTGLVEKYLIVESYLINDFDFNLIVIFANLILIGIAMIKIIFPLTSSDFNGDEEDISLARKIDRDFYLNIPSFTIVTLMILSCIFSKFIINYIQGFLL